MTDSALYDHSESMRDIIRHLQGEKDRTWMDDVWCHYYETGEVRIEDAIRILGDQRRGVQVQINDGPLYV